MGIEPRTVLFLGQDLETPSFRYRTRCLAPILRDEGWTVLEHQLRRRHYGRRIWEIRRLLARVNLVILAQFKLSAAEAWLLRRFVSHVVFDVDDAIYVRQPRRFGDPPNGSIWRRRKFAATCAYADCVVAGNTVIAAVARRTARAVRVVATPVDVTRYRASRPDPHRPPTIVWIGRPENLVYLELLHTALARLSSVHPGLRLRVVCSRFPQWSDVTIEGVQWSPAAEIMALETSDIGVMPLVRDEWTEGKCAFKLLQYMASSLPCVASPVGANAAAVIDGKTGFFAADEADWHAALERLIDSPPLRRTLGEAGRLHVEANYALTGYVRRYAALVAEIIVCPLNEAADRP